MFSPKKDMEGVGFHYTVTEEQVAKHRKLSVEEIFNWIEETNAFILALQTEEERNRKFIFKPNKIIPEELRIKK